MKHCLTRRAGVSLKTHSTCRIDDTFTTCELPLSCPYIGLTTIVKMRAQMAGYNSGPFWRTTTQTPQNATGIFSNTNKKQSCSNSTEIEESTSSFDQIGNSSEILDRATLITPVSTADLRFSIGFQQATSTAPGKRTSKMANSRPRPRPH